MQLEIERKFLVLNDDWRQVAQPGRYLRDGLIGPYGSSKVRVRHEGERASLTVKGPRSGLGRLEFEYEIPIDHADELLRSVCGPQIAKIRYDIPHNGFQWVVDVYEGSLAGVVLAEIELAEEEQLFSKPAWAGQEVSGDARFKKAIMLQLREKLGHPLTSELLLSLPRIESAVHS
jgi:adenylate cyclase